MENPDPCRQPAVRPCADMAPPAYGRLMAQNDDLAAQLADMQQALRLNEMVVAIVGHDLRNPLSAMLNGAELVSRLAADEKMLKVAGIMVASGRRMSRMIEQLLEVARIRAGRIGMKPVETDLHVLSRSIVDELQKARGAARIELTAEGATRGRFDPDRIGEAVSNLVGNALQHGAGESTIRVHIDGTSAEQLTLRVGNDGVIAQGTLATMFEPFHASRPGSGSQGGLGLGLYIVNQFVVAHGGTVRASTSPAAGTVIELVLPRDPPAMSPNPHGGTAAGLGALPTATGKAIKTSDLCRRAAVTATADTKISEISILMRTQHVGSVVVIGSADEPRPIGILTDRDIVLEVVGAGLDPRVVTAGEIMTTEPVVVGADDDIWAALEVMRERGVRRLPIVDASERVTGVIALDDVVQHVGIALSDITQLIGKAEIAEAALG